MVNQEAIFIVSAILLISSVSILKIANNRKQEHQVSDSHLRKLWKNWKNLHGKEYRTAAQESYRYLVFQNTFMLIEVHNQNADPVTGYRMGLNQFSDLTKQEFGAIYFSGLSRTASPVQESSSNNMPGDAVNWVDQGMVPQVRNMGECQASYAFAGVSTIESLYLIDTDFSVNLSPEQIIQCSTSYGNNGCGGGFNTNTLTYVSRKKLNSQSDYPYSSFGGTTGSCNYAQEDKGKYHSETIQYVPNDCNQVYNALFNKPVYVCIVPGFQLQYYTSGIFQASDCQGNQVSFCMSLVGTDGSNYWLLQNSWGTGWGQGGYIRLQYGNSCQICSDALQPGFT